MIRTHRLSTLAFTLTLALCMSVASAQENPAEIEHTIRIPDTATVVQHGLKDGVPFATVSRDAGKTFIPLERPKTHLMFHYAQHDPTLGLPEVPDLLRARGTDRLFVVQFPTQPLEEYRAGLRKLGVEIHHYLAHQAYLVRMSPAKLAAVRALPFVRHAGRFETAYKLEPAILDMIRNGVDPGTQRYNVVLVDEDRDESDLVAAIQSAGGRVVTYALGNILLEADLDKEQLLQVAAEDSVLWIDRWSEPEEDMDNARVQGGANYIEPKKPEKYTGKGIRGMIMEGIYATHPEFAATSYRAAPIVLGSATAAGHGNSTCGEVFALGKVAKARGLCPDGQIIYSNYSIVQNNNNRYTLVSQLVSTTLQYRGMFQTASWGYSRTTSYTSRSAEMDKIIFDLDIPITQSQSNAGATSVPRNSRPQAWAKNIIAVGGSRHRDNTNPKDDYWGRSGSIGPASDNRIKPDLCAYYDSIYTTGGSATSYTSSFGGTSGATPMVCGHLGLTLEMFTDGIFGHPMSPGGWQKRFENRPHFTTAKALMIANATPYRVSSTIHWRWTQGWGFPDLKTTYDRRNQLLVIDELDVLTNRQSVDYFVFATGTLPDFRIAMTYADPETAPVTKTPHRINDLTLSMNSPMGFFWGNNNLRGGNMSKIGGSADKIDTVECVMLPNPKRGIYQITIAASEINKDSHKETTAVDADFALVVNGITGSRDSSGLKLSLSSAASGDFRVALTNLPAGYSGGRVHYSADSRRPLGMGHYFGLEPDLLTAVMAMLPAMVGSPFGYLKTSSPTVFPNAVHKFDPTVAAGLKGITIDAVAYVADASGTIVDFSNCARVTVR